MVDQRHTSEKLKKHARSAAYKHGKYAKTVSKREATLQKRFEVDRNLPAIIRAHEDAAHGDYGGIREMATEAAIMSEVFLHKNFDQVMKTGGPLTTELVLGPGGVPVGERTVVNPGVDTHLKLTASLGYDAASQLKTPKALGQGALDLASAAKAQREAKLLDKKLGLPALDIRLLKAKS